MQHIVKLIKVKVHMKLTVSVLEMQIMDEVGIASPLYIRLENYPPIGKYVFREQLDESQIINHNPRGHSMSNQQ